ncbi:acetyltransferase [Natrinema salsiterrestre]|uniref:Acetyltransferase n=1 Tax=Natrinema salsiterrestre TaxID=2950540 RepID=A0A9Q4L0M3_9EURY|nr:acetyltransferase [Natrinema salsiterrestre]MDF9745851.1 acetyltransferase [Natrinema salsiterrestre]
MSMKVIYCAGEQGRVVLDILHSTGNYEEVVFADDEERLHGTEINQTEVIGGLDAVAEMGRDAQVLVAFGDQQTTRIKLAEKLAAEGFGFFNAVHESATVSDTASIGTGTMINGQSYVGPSSELNDHVLVDSCVSISHDSKVKKGGTVTPGVTLAGGVELGSDVYVGPGATVLEEVTVGKGAIIGAGSVVTEDIPAETTVIGSPAKPLK